MKAPTLASIHIEHIDVVDRFRKDLGIEGKTADMYESLEGLRRSISEHGLLHPVVVMRSGDRYKLLAGSRRLEACKALGWQIIPAHVYPEGISELEARAIELTENLNRKGLTWQELAKSRAEIDRLMKKKHGKPEWKTVDTAELVGTSQRTIEVDRELAEAMTVFPEIRDAKTRREAYGRLAQIKVRAATISEASDDKQVEELKDMIVKRFNTSTFNGDEQIQPSGIAIINEYAPLADVIKKMSPESWVVSFSQANAVEAEELNLPVERAIWQWQLLITSNTPQRLQENYETFYYIRIGEPILKKPGRSSIFSFRRTPRHMASHPKERPVELYQEILSTFVHNDVTVLAPDVLEGNIILASVNLGMKCYAFGGTDAELFKRRVYALPPGLYTSYESVEV